MEKYIPDIYQKSIYTIDYSKLLNNGIRCLLFDLDNTIAPIHDKYPSKKAKDLIISLKQKGFQVYIYSNSLYKRVNRFKKELNISGFSFCHKPLTRKIKKIFKKKNLNPKEVAIIGDLLLTDIALGNKVGITTILVNPIGKDKIYQRPLRYKENKIIKKLIKKGLLNRGNYYE